MMAGPRALAGELRQFGRQLRQSAGVLAELGPVEVGTTPRECIWEADPVRLYRYRPQLARPRQVPLLIVYALVNRPYMIDIQPDRSFVRGLLAAGVDVYLIDWGYPTAADRFLDFDDYVNGFLGDAVDQIRARHGRERIDLLGVCQGGVISLCHAALHPERVRKLVTLVTPVDFHAGDNRLARMVRDVDVDRLVDSHGTLPGTVLSLGYLALQPVQQLITKYLAMPEMGGERARWENFARMEKWIYDSPGQAGEMFRQFAKDCFQDNKLVAGTLEIGGARVDLGRVRMPVLNIYATRDHLVPPPASRALARCVGSRAYREVAVEGGHVGIFVGQRSAEVQKQVAEWLKSR